MCANEKVYVNDNFLGKFDCDVFGTHSITHLLLFKGSDSLYKVCRNVLVIDYIKEYIKINTKF
jgi:hypothetical protein